MLLTAYLGVWLMTSVAAMLAIRKVRERNWPVTVGLLAVLSGMLWPVLLVGGLQYGLVTLVAKGLRAADPEPHVDVEPAESYYRAAA